MKAAILNLVGWIVVVHCWISGALTVGMTVEWLGAGHFVIGLAIGLAAPGIPLILWLAIAADGQGRP